MPSHKTHELVGIVMAPLVFYGTWRYTDNPDITFLFTGVYIAATYLFSPDLDTDSKPYMRWNIFSLLWLPYKVVIPHRSWLSHSGPISGTIRFLYFLMWVVIIAYFLGIPLLTFTPYYVMLWIAIILVDSLHTLLDLLF